MLKAKFQFLTWPLFFLGLASFFTDVASEAMYPLFPLFLAQVLGAGPLFIGIFEGLAETVASLTKVIFGIYSDRVKNTKPFVIFGYSLANLARPLIGFAGSPITALLLRVTDRIGKGIRTAPRDAWLASLANANQRGLVFGFHRGMDHFGAAIGPLLASSYLFFYPNDYRHLFLLTLIPGSIAVFCILLVPKHQKTTSEPQPKPSPLNVDLPLPQAFKRYLWVLLLFTLGNSSDAFLLLKMQKAGIESYIIPILWTGLHLLKTFFSPLGGKFADQKGYFRSIKIGWLLFIVIYFVFGWFDTPVILVSAFLLYALFYAFTESAERAIVATLVPEGKHGTAYGWFNLTLGIAALPASLAAGATAETWGLNLTFLLSAGIGATALLILTFTKPTEKENPSHASTGGI